MQLNFVFKICLLKQSNSRTISGECSVEQLRVGLVGVWSAAAHLAVQAERSLQVAVSQPVPRTDASSERLGPQSRTGHSLH